MKIFKQNYWGWGGGALNMFNKYILEKETSIKKYYSYIYYIILTLHTE